MSNNGGSRNNGGSSSNGHVNGYVNGGQQQQPAAMIHVESDRVQYTEQAIVADYMYVVLLFKALSVDQREQCLV
jgi:hypothetical protein